MRLKANAGKRLTTLNTDQHPIEIREDHQHRWMHFGDGAIQSLMSLAQPERIILSYLAPLITGIELLHPTIRQLAILGLGGGSLYRYYHHHQPETSIAVVERCPMVIDLAERYFHLPPASTTRDVICADALHYLEQPHLQLDVIISDIYSTNQLPPLLKTDRFYQLCQQALSDQGLLALNYVISDPKELLETVQILKRTFGKSTLLLPIKNYDNVLVFASKRPLFHSILEQLIRQGDLVDVQYDFDLGYLTESLAPAKSQRQSIFERLFKSAPT